MSTVKTATPKSVKVTVKIKRPKKRFPSATKNILAILALATADEVVGGMSWYNDAHDFCKAQALAFGVSIEIVAGIVSALSPGTDWERNKADALQVLVNNRAHKFGTYGPNAVKAFRIRDVAAQARIDEFFEAQKTHNFYQNIVNPADKKFVTIDRHALSVALGAVRADKSITVVEYRELARAYTVAAKKVGLLPQQLQAITWVTWRNRKGLKSKFTLQDILDLNTAHVF